MQRFRLLAIIGVVVFGLGAIFLMFRILTDVNISKNDSDETAETDGVDWNLIGAGLCAVGVVASGTMMRKRE